MKKNTKIKKSPKKKSVQTSASAEQDIVGLITTLIGRLVALEGKTDMILNRLSVKVVQAPAEPSSLKVPAQQAQQVHNTRPMYKAVCADCAKDCEVPFKPGANRPVYCKECFSKRKNKGAFSPRPQEMPKVTPVSQVNNAAKPETVKPAISDMKKGFKAKKAKKKR